MRRGLGGAVSVYESSGLRYGKKWMRKVSGTIDTSPLGSPQHSTMGHTNRKAVRAISTHHVVFALTQTIIERCYYE